MLALERLPCRRAGHLTQGSSLYSDVLAELQPGVCSGLYAELLVKRADAQRQQGQFDAALADLDRAMAWEAENVNCLQLRALVSYNTDSIAGSACCLPQFLCAQQKLITCL